MNDINYTVVLVDRGEGRYLHRQHTEFFQVSFHESGTQVRGLRFKWSRPTTVINEIKQRDERYEHWFEVCVKPMLIKAKYIDIYEKGGGAHGEQTQL